MEYSFVFNLPRNDNTKLLGKLMDIYSLHATEDVDGKKAVFRNTTFRAKAGQWPYRIDGKTFVLEDDGSIDFRKLKKLIEETPEPTFVVIRDGVGNHIDQLYLPEAIENDPYKRAFVYAVDMETQFNSINDIYFKNTESDNPLP